MTDATTRAQPTAFLRQRIRSGELDERRVQLAAWLGYEPALQAAEPVGPEDVPSWAADWSPAHRVLRWGGALTHVEIVTLACDFAERVPQEDAGRAAIAAARAWASCPCEEHRQAAKAAEAAASAVIAADTAAAVIAAAAASAAVAASAATGSPRPSPRSPCASSSGLCISDTG